VRLFERDMEGGKLDARVSRRAALGHVGATVYLRADAAGRTAEILAG
jgi:hypothetical protein